MQKHLTETYLHIAVAKLNISVAIVLLHTVICIHELTPCQILNYLSVRHIITSRDLH